MTSFRERSEWNMYSVQCQVQQSMEIQYVEVISVVHVSTRYVKPEMSGTVHSTMKRNKGFMS